MATYTYTFQLTKTITVEVEAESLEEAKERVSDPDEGWDGAWDRAETEVGCVARVRRS